MPEGTLRAFADHGQATRALSESTAAAEAVLADAQDAGVDLAAVTAQLEREGVQSFCASYDELLDRIESRLREPSATTTRKEVP
jgi:transaldolase